METGGSDDHRHESDLVTPLEDDEEDDASIGKLGIIAFGRRNDVFPVGHPADKGAFDFPTVTGFLSVDDPDALLSFNPELIDNVVDIANRLVRQGAVAVITSESLLGSHPNDIAKRVPVPIVTSSLSQIPWLCSCISSTAKMGIITLDSTKLNEYHLIACGADPHLPIASLPEHGAWRNVESDEIWTTDAQLRRELIEVMQNLIEEHQISAVVMENSSMASFAPFLRQCFRMPVLTILDCAKYLYSISVMQ